MTIITLERFQIVRWNKENDDFSWWLRATGNYADALQIAEDSARESRLSTDMLGILDQKTNDIVSVVLKCSPEDLPLPLIQVYELKEWSL